MNIYGCFLVFGAKREPEVILLNDTRIAYFGDRCRLASTVAKDPETARMQVYRDIFGAGAEYAIPCWILGATKLLAERYEGPHQDRVRELAKAITCNRPYGPDERPWPKGGEPKGGQKAALDPVKPKPRKPSGGARISPSEIRAERQIRQMEGAQV